MKRAAPDLETTDLDGDRPARRRYRRDPLYDYPLVLPRRSAYTELEIEPEASDQEVMWAQAALAKRLGEEQKELETRLAAVYAEVEGLRDAYGQIDQLHGQGQTVDEGELRKAQRILRELEHAARLVDPAQFERHRRRVEELEGQIHRLNSMALDQPEKRREYDRETPPLALLRFASSHRLDFLTDVRATLFLLRSEISRFLTERGEEVLRPSDLTREDFSYEFNHNEILDGDSRRLGKRVKG